MANKKKKKTKLKGWVWVLLIIICSLSIIYSAVKILVWYNDNQKTEEQLKTIIEEVEIEEVPEEKEQIIEQPVEISPENDYWDFIKMPLISVDFSKLKEKNPETVAFIKVNGTNINYPVVQTDNNSYYLNHSFDRKPNGEGWVFLDYRNNINNLQDNTIIYAHGGSNSTMFGTLKNIVKNKWYENASNYVINISTPQENTLWQVVSIYKIETETYYLTSSFGSDESHQKYIDTILSRSLHNFNTPLTIKDKILTLSTCYNNHEKIVLHAKLIKKSAR